MKVSKIQMVEVSRPDQMPDIDLDFPSRSRDFIKDYFVKKYGENQVCSIGTYTNIKIKSAMKSLGRVYNINHVYLTMLNDTMDRKAEKWNELIDSGTKNAFVREFIKKNPQMVNDMYEIMWQPSTTSVHASAIVVFPEYDKDGNRITIYDMVPVKKVIDTNHPNGVLVSEWEGEYIDAAGFLKEDVLGLTLLDKFEDILAMIKEQYGKEIVLDEIELDHKPTMLLFAKGYSEDVFQFNSGGMKGFLKQARPRTVEHLIAMNALFRPGPMGSNMHKDYALLKNGRMKPTYDFMLEEVTKKTYGLYAYQEQIMQAVHVLGNLSLVEADEVRTIMKKFKKEAMREKRDKFLKGAADNGCSEEEAIKVWSKLEKFSGYGFNRSHSAAYALMAYWSQWLKYHYPLQFYTIALQYARNDSDINSIIGEISRIKDYVGERALKIANVDVNRSNDVFKADVEKDEILWGFLKVRGIAGKVADKLMEVRGDKPFKSVEDMLKRCEGNGVGKDKAKSLILAGGFDNVYGVKEEYERYDIIKEFCKYTGEKVESIVPTEKLGGDSNWWLQKQKYTTGFSKLNFKKIILRSGDETLKALRKYHMEVKDFEQRESEYKDCLLLGHVNNFSEKNYRNKSGKWAQVMLNVNEDTVFVCIWDEEWKIYKEEITQAKKYSRIIAIFGTIRYSKYHEENQLNSNKDTIIKSI